MTTFMFDFITFTNANPTLVSPQMDIDMSDVLTSIPRTSGAQPAQVLRQAHEALATLTL